MSDTPTPQTPVESNPFNDGELDHTQIYDDVWDEWNEARKAYKKAIKEVEAKDYDHRSQFDYDCLKSARMRFYKALDNLNLHAKEVAGR